MKRFVYAVLIAGLIGLSGCGSSEPISSPNPAAVQGMSANWLLAQQKNKYDEFWPAARQALSGGNTVLMLRLADIRASELRNAIRQARTGDYSISDKEKMIRVFQGELDLVLGLKAAAE